MNYKKAILFAFVFIIGNIGYSQTNEIKVRFIGNCGLYITDGNSNIYVDFPYKSGAHKYMEYGQSELDNIKDNPIFLFTHRHSDHYSKNLLKKVIKKFKGKVYGNWNISDLKELNSSIDDFSIKAIKTSHRFTFKHFSYVIVWHSKKILISGDTGDIEKLSKVKNIDWAFTNPWLFMNQNKEVKLDTKMYAMYHLYPNQNINGEIPENLIILKNQNEIISIPY